MFSNLRVRIPLLVFLGGLIISFGALQLSIVHTEGHLLDVLTSQSIKRSNQWARDIASSLRQRQPNIARSTILRLASDPQLVNAMLVDDQGMIVYSTELTEVGLSYDEAAGSNAVSIESVVNFQPLAQLSDDSNSLTVVNAVRLLPAPGELITSRSGHFVVQFDLSEERRQIRIAAYQRGSLVVLVVLLGCLALAISLDRWLTRPIQALRLRAGEIANRARRLEAGLDESHPSLLFDSDALSKNDGIEESHVSNELQSLGNSFESMARELQVRSERMQLQAFLLQHIDEAVHLSDAQGRIVFANEGCSQMFGYSRDDLIGMDIAEFNTGTPEARRQYDADLRRQLKQQNHWQGEIINLRKDGSDLVTRTRIRTLQLGGSDYFLTTKIDATSEKAAEEALKVSEARFRTYLTQIPAAVTLKDHEGNYVLVNPVFSEWFGVAPGEVEGKSPEEILDAELAARQRETLRKIAASRKSVAEEFTVTTVKGQSLSVLRYEFPIETEEGTLIGFGGVYMDITALRRTEVELREAQKMEAIGQLTGGVAHDFNNLLTVIMGNLELLVKETDEPAHRALAEEALAACRNGAELTGSLLTFARRSTLKPISIDLGKVVNEMTGLLERSLGELFTISPRLESGLWLATVDRNQMENVILNLVINARDAMPDGGTLTISTSNERLRSARKLRTDEVVPPGDYVTLSVRDTGIGMDEEVMQRAFEPFFTTKQVGQGTGLGLSMVYGFIKQSGGFVEIDSTLDVGTTVTLFLPRNESNEQGEESTDAKQEPRTGDAVTGARILVVEDQPAVRQLVTLQLQKLGYEVSGAEHGEEAKQILESGAAFDLLLCDMIFPGPMTGADIARLACELNPGLKVVFMSGYDRGLMSSTEFNYRYLSKPFSRHELADLIFELLEDS